jgi:hypothetical protein
MTAATIVQHIKNAQDRGGHWTPDRWECVMCGHQGYGTATWPYSWADPHLRGHAPCQWCGAVLTVKRDGTPRVHSRCARRPSLLPTPGGIS